MLKTRKWRCRCDVTSFHTLTPELEMSTVAKWKVATDATTYQRSNSPWPHERRRQLTNIKSLNILKTCCHCLQKVHYATVAAAAVFHWLRWIMILPSQNNAWTAVAFAFKRNGKLHRLVHVAIVLRRHDRRRTRISMHLDSGSQLILIFNIANIGNGL